MNKTDFERIVETSLKHLPRRFKQRVRNISLEIEDQPSEELLREMGIRSGTLFGLYQGVPLTEREWNYGNVLPDRIVIYQRPIERAAVTPAEIEKIVMETVMHEIGHYFGFSDDALNAMEKEKRTRMNDIKKR